MARLNLLTAQVGHKRDKPARNAFQYSVFYVDTPVMEERFATPRLFSFDRFNIFCIYTPDHGARDGSSWRSWFVAQCSARGITIGETDTIRLIAHPRLFGYAFNPISFWILQNEMGDVRAVLCEVNNTFGDNHCYLLTHEDGRPILPTDKFRAEKNLYVSPFNKVTGHYIFSFTVAPDTFKASINYFVGEERVLSTFVGGTLAPLTSRTILRSVLRYPFMTLMVVFRIHWQAVRLRIKGVQPTISSMPGPTSGGTTQGSSAPRQE